MSTLQIESIQKDDGSRSRSDNERTRKKSNVQKNQILQIQNSHTDKLQIFLRESGKSQYSPSHQSSLYINQNDKLNTESVDQQSLIQFSQLTKIKSNGSIKQTKNEMIGKNKLKNAHKQNIKNLDDIKVQFKKIQEYQDQRNLQNQAKNFILKLKQQKSQFQGRLYLIKRNQQMKKKQRLRKQNQAELQEVQIKRMLRKKQIQLKLQLFKKKQLQRIQKQERQQLRKKRKTLQNNEYAVSKDRLQKLKLKLKHHRFNSIQQIQPVTSPTNVIGNRYLKQSGRIHKRARTESSHYNELTEEQKYELDKIRQKIDILTKLIRH